MINNGIISIGDNCNNTIYQDNYFNSLRNELEILKNACNLVSDKNLIEEIIMETKKNNKNSIKEKLKKLSNYAFSFIEKLSLEIISSLIK